MATRNGGRQKVGETKTRKTWYMIMFHSASSEELNELWPAEPPDCASIERTLWLTHLLLRPPTDSASPGTDTLCLGKSDRIGAGRLHPADPTPPSGLGSRRRSMYLSGRGNSSAPWTLVCRRSQHSTEQGLDCSSEGARLNWAVSGISQAWGQDMMTIMKRKEEGRGDKGKERLNK